MSMQIARTPKEHRVTATPSLWWSCRFAPSSILWSGVTCPMPVFVAAFHQTGLDTRSMTRRSIKVDIRGGGGRARGEARALVTMMHLAHPKVAQPKPRALRHQVCLCWTRPSGEPAGAMPFGFEFSVFSFFFLHVI